MNSPLSRFDERYFAEAYRDYGKQNPARKLRYYRKLIASPADGPPGKRAERRLLDAGCGPGLFLAACANDPVQRFGIDPAAAVMRKASPGDPGTRFSCGSITGLPFNNAFDILTAFDVLEHAQDLEAAAQSVRQSLRHKGTFVFVVPVYDGPLGGIVRFLDKDDTHVHKEPRKFWLTWTRAHFEHVVWQGVFRCFFRQKWYLHFPTTIFRRIAPAIAVTATKE